MSPATKRILLLTGNHLRHNPRALKEATTLARAGYSVEVLGAWLDEILRARDQALMPHLPFAFTPVVDLAGNRVIRASSAVRSRVRQGMHRWTGWQNRWQFGPTVNALRDFARSRHADLYILLAAAPLIEHPLEIHFRGRPAAGFDRWLADRFSQQGRVRVFLHPLVGNDDLLSRIAEHDIGFAGETKVSRSRDLAVTNKMLHYPLAGLAVVASDTSGQLEIAAQTPEAVTIYPSGDAAALAAALNALLESPERLHKARAAALRAASATFSREREQPRLLESVERVLSMNATPGVTA